MKEISAMVSDATELRSAFDQAFAAPHSSLEKERKENLLALCIGGNSYAVRVGEITGLANDRKVVGVPGPVPELLGVTSIRGQLTPVYSLAALLNYRQEQDQSRWLILYGLEEPIGLAFSDFKGYFRVPAEHVFSSRQETLSRKHVHEVVRVDDTVRSIINIPSVVEVIKRRCGEGRRV